MSGTGDEPTPGAPGDPQQFLDEFLSSMDGWDTSDAAGQQRDAAGHQSDGMDLPNGNPESGPAHA